MEVVGGQGSKDSESNENGKPPVSNLVLFWSADPHLLYKPFQANTMKELVYFFPQVPYLLKTDGWDFVLENTFVHLLGFFKTKSHPKRKLNFGRNSVFGRIFEIRLFFPSLPVVQIPRVTNN